MEQPNNNQNQQQQYYQQPPVQPQQPPQPGYPPQGQPPYNYQYQPQQPAKPSFIQNLYHDDGATVAKLLKIFSYIMFGAAAVLVLLMMVSFFSNIGNFSYRISLIFTIPLDHLVQIGTCVTLGLISVGLSKLLGSKKS